MKSNQKVPFLVTKVVYSQWDPTISFASIFDIKVFHKKYTYPQFVKLLFNMQIGSKTEIGMLVEMAVIEENLWFTFFL